MTLNDAIQKLKLELVHPIPMSSVRAILDVLFDEQYQVDAHSMKPDSEVLTFNVRGVVKDGKLTVEGRCRHCGETGCYKHCNDADDAIHVLDRTSSVQADVEGVVDVSCKLCGQGGSFAIPNDDEINWE